jgi:hypothetical protein
MRCQIKKSNTAIAVKSRFVTIAVIEFILVKTKGVWSRAGGHKGHERHVYHAALQPGNPKIGCRDD